MLRNTIAYLSNFKSSKLSIKYFSNKGTDIPEVSQELACCQSGCANCVWLGKRIIFVSRFKNKYVFDLIKFI